MDKCPKCGYVPDGRCIKCGNHFKWFEDGPVCCSCWPQNPVGPLPTPNSRDWKGAPGKGCQERGGHQSSLPAEIGGQLNPTWVEWLMGYPTGWTELEPWAMLWFRPKQKKHSNDKRLGKNLKAPDGMAWPLNRRPPGEQELLWDRLIERHRPQCKLNRRGWVMTMTDRAVLCREEMAERWLPLVPIIERHMQKLAEDIMETLTEHMQPPCDGNCVSLEKIREKYGTKHGRARDANG